MKLGSITISKQKRTRRTISQQVSDHLASAEVRELLARMIRSEVKNHLAELAEEAEMPFPSAAGFLRGIVAALRDVSTTNLTRDPDDDYDPGADAPFVVIDALPGHNED